MASLLEIRDELVKLNGSQERTSDFIQGLLQEAENERKATERARGKQREKELEGRRQKASRPAVSSMGIGEAFGRGMLGDGVYDAYNKLIAGAFGAAGGLIPALAMGAGRAIRFGGIALALNSFIDDAVEHVFEGFTFDDAMTPDEKTKLKQDVQTGLNAGIAAKFLGLGWRKSLGVGLGVAASDMIGDALQERFATDESGQFVMSNPLSGLGIGGEDIKIDLSDPMTRDIIGGAVGIIGVEIARYAARGFLKMGARGIAIALGAAGFAKLAELMGRLEAPTIPPRDGPSTRGRPTPPVQPAPTPAPTSTTRGNKGFAERLKAGKLIAGDLKNLSAEDLARYGYQRTGAGGIRPMPTADQPFTKFMKAADIVADINSKLTPNLMDYLKIGGRFGLRAAPVAAAGYDAYLGSLPESFYRSELDMGPVAGAVSGVGEGVASMVDLVQNIAPLPGQPVDSLPLQLGANLARIVTGQQTEPVQYNTEAVQLYQAGVERLVTLSTKTYELNIEKLEAQNKILEDTGIKIKGVVADALAAQKVLEESTNTLGTSITYIDQSSTDNSQRTNAVKAETRSLNDMGITMYDRYALESLMMQQGVRFGYEPRF